MAVSSDRRVVGSWGFARWGSLYVGRLRVESNVRPNAFIDVDPPITRRVFGFPGDVVRVAVTTPDLSSKPIGAGSSTTLFLWPFITAETLPQSAMPKTPIG